MKDLSQFKPIETGTLTEVQPVDTTKGSKDGKPATPVKDVSAMSENDKLTHTDAKKAKLEKKVTFEDGQAVTEPTTEGSTETQGTPTSGTTTHTDGTPHPETKPDVEVPAGLKGMNAKALAMVADAVQHCKDQNFKAALDVLDKAIANHRKMMDEAAKHHKKMAPILDAKKQAQLLEQLRNKFIALEASLKVIDSKHVKP